jgi:hypothetical protein
LFAGSAPPPIKHVASVKSAPAPSPYIIEVITGGKRENKSFPNP